MCRTGVILAGGLGKRLYPHTIDIPKPLLKVDGRPILDIILSQLAKADFNRIILALNHQADQLRAFCQDGAKWSLNIEYSQEIKPLGTIGPIKEISSLPEDFLILNGDTLTDLDFRQFFDLHVRKRNLFTVASLQEEDISEYGILEVEKGRLISFKEKPILQKYINMGIYMANRKILEEIPKDTFYGFDDLVLKLLSLKKAVSVFTHRGTWIDIGSLKNYEKAQNMGVF
jgi:NDP-sugar pyrophosphorylase family protein